MATTKRFDEFTPVFQGLSGETDIKLKDVIPVQHIHVASAEGEQSINGTRRLSVADTMCKPYIVASAIDGNGIFTASCRNFSDFSTTLTDSEGNSHSLLGLTIKVRFDVACNYGDGSSTYPKININSLGAVPITCQGKLAASGFCGAGQQFEATLSLVNINGTETLTWDIDTNVKGYANGVIDNADGTQVYNKSQSDSVLNSALSNYIDLRNYVDKDCGDITIGSGGYANLGIYVPNGKTAIFTKVLYWDSSTGGFNVFAYSKYAYIVANPNTVIRGLRVRLYYIDERFS